MKKKELLQQSYAEIEKAGFTILSDKKTTFVDYFVKKNNQKYSVEIVVPERKNKFATEFDIKKAILSALMDKNTPLIFTEYVVDNEIKSAFKFAEFISLH